MSFEEGREYETLAGGESKISFVMREGDTGAQDWEKVLVMPGMAKIVERKEVSVICAASL